MKLQIQRIKDVEMPSYAHEGDAAFDLRSAEELLILPGEKQIIKTGLKMAIPKGHVGLIWDRSGLAAKHALHCLAGVIDSGYRGEIGIVIINLGNEQVQITKNMRVAQMLVQPIINTIIEETKSLDETARNEGGFGSTGTL